MPRSRATCAIGRPDSKTSRTARSRNSSEYFLGAAMAGASPSPRTEPGVGASKKPRVLRLNRGGDRELNRALYTIVLCRLAHHAETKRYAARRAAEGKTPREIKRCLKRHLARRLFRLLEANAPAPKQRARPRRRPRPRT